MVRAGSRIPVRPYARNIYQSNRSFCPSFELCVAS